MILDRNNEFFVRQLHGIGGGGGGGGAASIAESWDAYVVDLGLLPGCIPPRLADKALFAGKASLVLKSLGTSTKDAPACLSPQELSAAEQELALLTRDPNAKFSVFHLERIVDFVRQRIAGRLWQVVTDRGELFPALAAFKEFMLAGNGLFFQELYVTTCTTSSTRVYRARVAAVLCKGMRPFRRDQDLPPSAFSVMGCDRLATFLSMLTCALPTL